MIYLCEEGPVEKEARFGKKKKNPEVRESLLTIFKSGQVSG